MSTPSGRGIVEVKCPYRCRNTPLAAVASQQKTFLQLVDKKLSLKCGHAYYYQVQMALLVTNMQWADFVVWRPSELFVERLERDDNLIATMLPKLDKFYMEHLLLTLVAAQKPAPNKELVIPPVREVVSHFRLSFLPHAFSQHTIDGHNGSSACTVIAAEVVNAQLAGALPELYPDQPLPASAVSGLFECIRNGNAIYDRANLRGQLLAIYDALNLLRNARLDIAPWGNKGCCSIPELSSLLVDLANSAETSGMCKAGILTQTPYSIAVVFAPSRVVTIYDSHGHGAEEGALIACGHCKCEEVVRK